MFQNIRLKKLLEKMLLNKKKPRFKIYFTQNYCLTAFEQLDPDFRNLLLQAGFGSLFVNIFNEFYCETDKTMNTRNISGMTSHSRYQDV